MNSRQRKQLVESYSREHSNAPAWRLGLALKCAVCVAVVALLVVIGSREDKPGMAKDARSNVASPVALTSPSAAAVDRKEVFDARRAHFEGNTSIPGKRYAAATARQDPATSKGIADATCSGGVDGGMDASGSQCSKGAAAASR